MIAASFAAAENVTYPQLAKLLPVYTLSPRVWPDRSPPAATNKDTLTAVKYVADYRALPCTPEGCYTALRPLTGAAEYAWGAVSLILSICSTRNSMRDGSLLPTLYSYLVADPGEARAVRC